MRLHRFFCVAVAMLLGASTLQADIIDSFEDGNFTLATSTSDSTILSGVAEAVGGVRKVDVLAAGGGNAVVQLLADLGLVDDSITMATDSSTTGFFQFGYGTGTTAAPLNMDILNIDSMSQFTSLAIDYVSNTNGSATITISDGIAVSTVGATYNAGTSTMLFDYGDFLANSVGGSLDLTSIDSVQVNVGLTNSPLPGALSFSEFRQDGFLAIPEPTAALVLFAGMTGLVAQRRRRS